MLNVGPMQQIDAASAISYNNGKGFRLDWVRNLQMELLGQRISTDGTFDENTVYQVARFQWTHGEDIDGKIGPNTRRKLESIYPSLLTTITGEHLDSRVLVPAAAQGPQRFAYWRNIIEEAGGVFQAGAGQINLLGIRGVKIADGTDAHQINGTTLPDGTIYQTTSAQDFVTNRAAGRSDDHMDGAHTGFDDLMVSLWIDAEGQLHVQERRGNVDPRSLYTSDRYGTGHLRDGQYAYRVGTHGTGSRSHRAAARGIEDPNDELRVRNGGGRTSYRALVPTRNQEVWRNSAGNDRFISEEEEATSNDRIYSRHNRYMNNNFAMNIHTSSTDHPNSQGCQNVPADEYLGFMQEIFASTNQDNILYTLIDASKIENGLVIQSQEPIAQ